MVTDGFFAVSEGARVLNCALLAVYKSWRGPGDREVRMRVRGPGTVGLGTRGEM